MGIDKSLWDEHPSVMIGGARYHYGREKEYGQYLVENASYAKDYWCFDRKEDLQAFLITLPESADRDRTTRLHPDWSEVTHEQRTLYLQEDKADLRAMAEDKIKAGDAPAFSMDLDGEHGPHAPQRASQLGCLPRSDAGLAGLEALTECHNLRSMDDEIRRDERAARVRDYGEVDAATYPERVVEGARMVEEGRPLRPLTLDLVECCKLDAWPRNATVVDFGIDSSSHLGALQFALREQLVSPRELDDALGDGEALTAIARRGRNPYGDVTFKTAYDDMPREEDFYDEPVGQFQVWHARDMFAAMQADSHGARLPEFPRDFTLAGVVEACDLSHAYQLANNSDVSWTRNPEVKQSHAAEMRSTSVGDVIVDPQGVANRVATVGFEPIKAEPRKVDPIQPPTEAPKC